MRRFSTLRINDFQDQSGGIGFSGACIIVFHCQTVANARRNVGGLLTLGPVRQVSTAQESCTAQVKPQKCHNVMNVMHFIEDNKSIISKVAKGFSRNIALVKVCYSSY